MTRASRTLASPTNQTYDYARHFLSACETILFCDVSPTGIEFNAHVTEVCICPVGIDPDAVSASVHSPDTAEALEAMKKQFAGRKVCISLSAPLRVSMG